MGRGVCVADDASLALDRVSNDAADWSVLWSSDASDAVSSRAPVSDASVEAVALGECWERFEWESWWGCGERMGESCGERGEVLSAVLALLLLSVEFVCEGDAKEGEG